MQARFVRRAYFKLSTSHSKLVENFGQAVRTQNVDGLLADLLEVV